VNAPYRRGACPGLSAPMLTGDGLLVRLTSTGATIALEAFAGLCAAARQHGNGIVEITSRGNIQFRGLTAHRRLLLRLPSDRLISRSARGLPFWPIRCPASM